jgi:hypothetical protein
MTNTQHARAGAPAAPDPSAGHGAAGSGHGAAAWRVARCVAAVGRSTGGPRPRATAGAAAAGGRRGSLAGGSGSAAGGRGGRPVLGGSAGGAVHWAGAGCGVGLSLIVHEGGAAIYAVAGR